MRKKTIAIISLGAFAALCWTFMIFFSAFITGYRVFKWTAKSTERIVFVEKANLESEPGVRVLDANNPFFKVTRSEPNRVNIEWGQANIILRHPKCRVKQLAGTNVRVMGRLNDNKEYPVVIDSGHPKGLGVTDTVVTDSRLEIYPMKFSWNIGGLCHAARIEIGEMTITNPLCHYMLGHYEKKLLGRTIWKEEKILFGLELMRKFAYILIDDVASEIKFCAEGSFQADPNQSWSQYSMSIERDEQNQQRLMVDTPIAGQPRRIELDTGAASGLILTENIWPKIAPGLQVRRQEKDRLGTPLAGWLPCKKITVDQLTIGNISISDAQIHVTAKDYPFGQDEFTLGMGFFRDTVIVLDFERELMWIKNLQSR